MMCDSNIHSPFKGLVFTISWRNISGTLAARCSTFFSSKSPTLPVCWLVLHSQFIAHNQNNELKEVEHLCLAEGNSRISDISLWIGQKVLLLRDVTRTNTSVPSRCQNSEKNVTILVFLPVWTLPGNAILPGLMGAAYKPTSVLVCCKMVTKKNAYQLEEPW